MMTQLSEIHGALGCPTETLPHETILLGHGGGGRLMHHLLSEVILPILNDPFLNEGGDSAIIPPLTGHLAVTTDSFVVQPLVFPGGDIGSLAIHGSVNDLAMAAARPLYLTVGLILEEGCPLSVVTHVLRSLADTARGVGVRIIAGDTKVVERGKGDLLYLTTTGVGIVQIDPPPSPHRIKPGDLIVVSGDIGRHGIAVMSARAGFTFHEPVLSDSAPLWGAIESLLDAGVTIHAMRDITRGGLAAVVKELALSSGKEFALSEENIPVSSAVREATEILGFDPLHLACEGRFILCVPESDGERTIRVLSSGHRGRPTAAEPMTPRIIGQVLLGRPGRVTLATPYGSRRYLEAPAGEVLPRIC